MGSNVLGDTEALPELCLPAPQGTRMLRVPGLLWMPSDASLLAGWRPAGWGAAVGSGLLFGLLVVGAWLRGAATQGSPCAPSGELLRIAPLWCLQGGC